MRQPAIQYFHTREEAQNEALRAFGGPDVKKSAKGFYVLIDSGHVRRILRVTGAFS